MKKARLQHDIKQINDALTSYGYYSLGNLFEPTPESIEQTTST